ncbi:MULTISPECIES: RNA-guided endonuclease TnpB family protein [Moorena]|nr:MULTISPECIES: RNA-guided endonuclease TnpB family protein [Moorena]NES86212.1 transposase [Moorena sp. SIO2B7]NEP36535.1 transposase [Moorena sp. SIO3B2]NEP67534.1 transposase [Moorena sp. SIO3A5]NEQ06704.1 transposase [Moorena sp. SIO4E2]NER89753.1 transposase [Moorena sp. SIO3A2]
MLTMTYEYKLQPTPEQTAIIEQTLDVCRCVWNFALRQRKDWCNSRKSAINACSIHSEYIISADEPFPNYHKQAKQLTEAKKQYPQLKMVHSQVLQQTLRTLDRAWDDMKARGFGFPRFKNKYRMRSFVFPQLGLDPIRNDAIKFPKLGWVQWRQSRPIPHGFEVRQARIVSKASGYFVMLSLQLNVDVPNPIPHGHPRGLDLGFDKFVATSDGEEIKRPLFLKTLQSQLKLLQRRLKNKQKGSNNRHKLNQKIARLHQRISDTRKDWHFKLAHHLCDGAGMIFVEDINFVSWQRGILSKHSADAGFGQFVNILEWVCFLRNVYFAKVNKDGTSQTCPNCGAHTGKKTLDVRSHHCNECGYRTTRDVAASQVLRNRGISALGHSVLENVCGLRATGSIGHDALVGGERSRKPASRGSGIPFLKATEHSEVARGRGGCQHL